MPFKALPIFPLGDNFSVDVWAPTRRSLQPIVQLSYGVLQLTVGDAVDHLLRRGRQRAHQMSSRDELRLFLFFSSSFLASGRPSSHKQKHFISLFVFSLPHPICFFVRTVVLCTLVGPDTQYRVRCSTARPTTDDDISEIHFLLLVPPTPLRLFVLPALFLLDLQQEAVSTPLGQD